MWFFWSCAPCGESTDNADNSSATDNSTDADGGGATEPDSIQETLSNQLSSDLKSSGFSDSEIETIVSYGEQQVNDNVTDFQNPEAVIPEYLSGSMAGVGSITPPFDDNKTLESIGIIVSSIVGSIDSLEAQITSNRSNRISQDIFDAILANLVTVAINALEKTGLAEEYYEEGL